MNLTDMAHGWSKYCGTAIQTPNTIPSGYKAVPKFEPGDIVETSVGKAEILESCGADVMGSFEYLLRSRSGAEFYDYEFNLNNKVKEYTVGTKCECGATFTDFPDIHLSYCPKFKEQK